MGLVRNFIGFATSLRNWRNYVLFKS